MPTEIPIERIRSEWMWTDVDQHCRRGMEEAERRAARRCLAGLFFEMTTAAGSGSRQWQQVVAAVGSSRQWQAGSGRQAVAGRQWQAVGGSSRWWQSVAGSRWQAVSGTQSLVGSQWQRSVAAASGRQSVAAGGGSRRWQQAVAMASATGTCNVD